MYMKKLLAVSILTLAPLGMAQADDDVGCGAGTMVFEGKEGAPFKVLAATTNGSSGNQTFGISSGTLGCNQGGTVTAQLSDFTSKNMDRLAKDMAVGQGESLAAMADLMGVSSQDKGHFFELTQSNYEKIFVTADVTSNDVIKNIQGLMAADQKLAVYTS